jgi:hypothetical protein
MERLRALRLAREAVLVPPVADAKKRKTKRA